MHALLSFGRDPIHHGRSYFCASDQRYAISTFGKSETMGQASYDVAL